MKTNKRICKRCKTKRFATWKGVLVCAKCGEPKTKRGKEKLENLEELRKEREKYLSELEEKYGRN